MLDLPAWADVPLRGLLLTAFAVLWTLVLIRLVGLRSLSKMTPYDFVATIAVGSLIASTGTATSWTEFFQGVAALAGVFLIQFLLAKARKKSDRVEAIVHNEPVILMKDGQFIDRALEETRVSRSDVFEKLRAHKVNRMDSIKAVVLETTGDISVVEKGSEDVMMTGVPHA